MNPRLAGSLLCALMFFTPIPAMAMDLALSPRLSERTQTHPLAGDVASDSFAPLRLQLSSDARASIIDKLVLLRGRAMLGTDYVFGGNSSKAVDCSALVQQIFRTAGMNLPRTSRELAVIGRAVRAGDIETGDLVFYRWKRNSLHVAVYLGERRILHASPGAGEVVVTELNDAWNRRMVSARRII